MTTLFGEQDADDHQQRYREQWENALLAGLLSGQIDMEEHDRRQLMGRWFEGSFNGAAAHVAEGEESGQGTFEWIQAGPTQFDCIYTAPYGLKCSLARAYEQPDGSWAALVIAGVRDDLWEAIAAAEWAIARLSAA